VPETALSREPVPPALEAPQPLDLLHMRHEDGVVRIARQLRADVIGLRGEERQTQAAEESRRRRR
jgi:hypothetical protein